jgi:hypothetical protein
MTTWEDMDRYKDLDGRTFPLWENSGLTPRTGMEYRKGTFEGKEIIAIIIPSLGYTRYVFDEGEGISMVKITEGVNASEELLRMQST